VPDLDRDRCRLSWEEWMNAGSHGLGLIFSILGFFFLVVLATRHGAAWCRLSCAVYGCTLVTLYLISTLYHSAYSPRWKRTLRILDHSAIYLLIAGTYTPFLLVNLRGGWGWSLFGTIWACALLGIALEAVLPIRYKALSSAVYIAMGWLVVIAAKPLITHVSRAGIGWLVAGGILYTAGVVFYISKRIPFGHAVWHLFVMAGSTCHYFAILIGVVLTSAAV